MRKGGNMDRPNLFKYATSELSQDAFICWLFEHLAHPDLQSSEEAKIARTLLDMILKAYSNLIKDSDLSACYSTLPDYCLGELCALEKIHKQDNHHDVKIDLVHNGKPFARLLIEDKTSSEESFHQQLATYWAQECAVVKDRPVIPVFWKTDYVCAARRKEIEGQCVVIGSREITEAFASGSNLSRSNHEILCSWLDNIEERFFEPARLAKHAVSTCQESDTIADIFRKRSGEMSTAAFVDTFIEKIGVNESMQDCHCIVTQQGGSGHTDMLWIYQGSRKRSMDCWRIDAPSGAFDGYAVYIQLIVQVGGSGNPKVCLKTVPTAPGEAHSGYLSQSNMKAIPGFSDVYARFRNQLRSRLQDTIVERGELCWKTWNYHLEVLSLDFEKVDDTRVDVVRSKLTNDLQLLLITIYDILNNSFFTDSGELAGDRQII